MSCTPSHLAHPRPPGPQQVIYVRRSVYYREHAAGAYSVGPYIAAEFLVEVPYIIVQAIIYSLIVYW